MQDAGAGGPGAVGHALELDGDKRQGEEAEELPDFSRMSSAEIDRCALIAEALRLSFSPTLAHTLVLLCLMMQVLCSGRTCPCTRSSASSTSPSSSSAPVPSAATRRRVRDGLPPGLPFSRILSMP